VSTCIGDGEGEGEGEDTIVCRHPERGEAELNCVCAVADKHRFLDTGVRSKLQLEYVVLQDEYIPRARYDT